MRKAVDLEQTRHDIRATFRKWDIDPSEFEILWEEAPLSSSRTRMSGAIVHYMRNAVWQQVSCYGFTTRGLNLRQCFLLLDRLRIAEQHGVQYQGLTFTKEVMIASTEVSKKADLLDAYDILGVSPDDPIDLIKQVYLRKSIFYHPDKGGDAEKFKRLTKAYELIMGSRK